MSAKKKYIVLVMLLLMLAAALANFFMVNRAYDSSVERLATTVQNANASAGEGVAATPAGASSVGDTQVLSYKGPGWRGDVTLNKIDGGSYEVTIRASDLQDATVPITSFEIDVRRPDSDSPILMPVFNQKGDGYFTATVQFPGQGDWEVRVRMHRELQTLEFARRFHIE